MELVQSIGDIFPQVLVEIGDPIQECIKSYKVEEEMVFGEGVVKILLTIY